MAMRYHRNCFTIEGLGHEAQCEVPTRIVLEKLSIVRLPLQNVIVGYWCSQNHKLRLRE